MNWGRKGESRRDEGGRWEGRRRHDKEVGGEARGMWERKDVEGVVGEETEGGAGERMEKMRKGRGVDRARKRDGRREGRKRDGEMIEERVEER